MVEVRAMQTPVCEAKIDRMTVGGELRTGKTPPAIPGYEVVRNTLVRSRARVKTYARVCEYQNGKTGVRIYLRYQPVLRGLSPFQLTVIANDRRILSCPELQQIVRSFSVYRLRLLELALDFSPESHIDAAYVRRHALFGKSRPRTTRQFKGSMRYGGRRCSAGRPSEITYFTLPTSYQICVRRLAGTEKTSHRSTRRPNAG
jgi:hypothetical protein